MFAVLKRALVAAACAACAACAVCAANEVVLGKCTIQEWAHGRIRAENESGEVRVAMLPQDGDSASGQSRYSAQRQRNEVSVDYPPLTLPAGKEATFTLTFELKTDIARQWGVSADSGNFYHFMQLKPDAEGTPPLFTVGMQEGHLAVYDCLRNKPNHILKGVSMQKPVLVKLTVKNTEGGSVQYTVGGQSGTYNCGKLGHDQLHLKFGQYRSYPNPVSERTEVAFRNIGKS